MTSKTKPQASLDEQVILLFRQVQQRQRDIAATEKPSWETTCTIGTNEGDLTDWVNLQTITNPDKLIEIAAFLFQKHTFWVRACQELGLTTEFKWMGYSRDQWIKDIRTRLSQIQLAAKRAELKTMEARLDRLISTEQRRELELAEIQKQLNGG